MTNEIPPDSAWQMEPDVPALTKAADDVLAERKRQIAAEGWTPKHDDSHAQGQMAWAAACYVLIGRQHNPAAAVRTGDQIAHETWPWAMVWFKPTNQRRNLVKAAALIIAEIERLDRISFKGKWPVYRLLTGGMHRQDVPGGRWEPLDTIAANALLERLDGIT